LVLLVEAIHSECVLNVFRNSGVSLKVHLLQSAIVERHIVRQSKLKRIDIVF